MNKNSLLCADVFASIICSNENSVGQQFNVVTVTLCIQTEKISAVSRNNTVR